MRLISWPCRLVAMSKTRMLLSNEGLAQNSIIMPDGPVFDKRIFDVSLVDTRQCQPYSVQA